VEEPVPDLAGHDIDPVMADVLVRKPLFLFVRAIRPLLA
jgi:hypothetical protein